MLKKTYSKKKPWRAVPELAPPKGKDAGKRLLATLGQFDPHETVLFNGKTYSVEHLRSIARKMIGP